MDVLCMLDWATLLALCVITPFCWPWLPWEPSVMAILPLLPFIILFIAYYWLFY